MEQVRDEIHPKPTRREIRRRETIERILDAAMRIVAEEGYEAFTIARLAGDLGYAVGALYRYFKGKDTILVALELRVLEQLRRDALDTNAKVESLVTRSELTKGDAAVIEALVAVGAYESLERRRPTDAKLLALALSHHEGFSSEALAAFSPELQDLFDIVRQHLASAATAGTLTEGDAGTRAMALWSACHGLLGFRKMNGFEQLRAPALFDEVASSLMTGWGVAAKRCAELTAAARTFVDALPDDRPRPEQTEA